MTASSKSRKSRIASSVASMIHTNAVYFPSMRIYNGDTPATLNYGCISHVYYAYAHVTRDGHVFVSSPSIVSAKARFNPKLTAASSSATSGQTRKLLSTAFREAWARSCISSSSTRICKLSFPSVAPVALKRFPSWRTTPRLGIPLLGLPRGWSMRQDWMALTVSDF